MDRGESESSYSLLQEIIFGSRSTESTLEIVDAFAPELILDTSAQQETPFREELDRAEAGGQEKVKI
jgi:hypothetical protein